LAEKTEKEILEKAKQIELEAKQKVKELKEKARLKRQKELAKLGELTVKFLNKEIEKDELKSFAIENKFIQEEEK